MLRRRLALLLIALSLASFTVGRTSAQTSIPNGVFVQETIGATWLVMDGKRVEVPLWPASDSEINAIPTADRWLVLNESGMLSQGERPSWCSGWVPCYFRTGAAVSDRKIVQDVSTFDGRDGLKSAMLVNAVEPDVKSTENTRPEGRFFSADITVRNVGDLTFEVTSSLFRVQTAEGFVIERYYGAIRRPDLVTSRLGAGQLVRGWVTWDVPRNSKVVSVIYQPSGGRQYVLADLSPGL